MDEYGEICICCGVGYPKELCLYGLENGCEITDDKANNPTEEIGEKVLTDPVSTGRKRAARMYPISPGQICEWSYKKNCGGGPERILGCMGRPAQAIHHGPDKSTLNNDKSNISIICDHCHNRYHAANDKYYIEPRPADNSEWIPTLQNEDMPLGLLEDMVPATKQEIIIQEMNAPMSRAERRTTQGE